MQPTKKILVGLDKSKMDDTLIDFISYATRSSPAEDIYFIHVVSSANDDSYFSSITKKIDEEAIESHRKELEEHVGKVLESHGKARIHCIIRFGTPFKEILNFISEQDIDIVISGHKKASSGSGILNQRLARRAPCNLIVIPEGHVTHLSRLLIPVDFSDFSQRALEYAIYISRINDSKVELVCQNIYYVPTGYHYSGKTYEEFAEVMKENAERDFKNWVSKIDTAGVTITPVFTLDREDNFGQAVRKEVLDREVSGVIIGAKGRSATSAIFIGSTAEKLVAAIDYLPLTIVRPKGETTGILESLGEL